jgi:hypothetical protein
MSHLETPRIVVAGRFISDVSTINNDTANFDPNTTPSNLGWNPRGCHTFDFYACSVTGAVEQAGPAPTGDPVLALAVSGAPDRPSGKMVDLDPDWQMSSQIWGLTVRLFDPRTEELALQGTFGVSAFRDLFSRQLVQMLSGNTPNGQPSGGRFISVLSHVVWGPVANRSPLLEQLRTATEDGELAIALNLFGYYYSNVDGRHTTGALVGCIGPHRRSEPRSFVACRRLQPLALPMPGGRPAVLIGPAEAVIDPIGRATVDLGHALLISDTNGTISDISRIGTALADMKALEFGVLPDESRKSGDRLGAGVATVFGEIDYLGAGWYARSGGVASFGIDAPKVQRAANRPLALFARMGDGSHLVLNRETRNGLYLRADNFVQRLDSGEAADVIFFARSYGRPAANQTIHLALSDAANNTPSGAITFQEGVTTDAAGKASLRLSAGNPGNARPRIDGQIYALVYSLQLDAKGRPEYEGTGLNVNFDVVVAHVRSAFPVPQRPEWHRDIQPIMAQYAQLYPVMSRHLFDLNNYDVMVEHRELLLLAINRNVEDPNYMPVTRDLSNNKRAAIIRWLQTETGNSAEPLVKGTRLESVVATAPAERPPRMAMRARAFGEDDIKRAMARLFAEDTEAVLSDYS